VVYRGAGNSQGRTSWKSKPEQNDYIAFIGFMVYYSYHLQPPSLPTQDIPSEFNRSEDELHSLSPIPSQTVPPPRSTSAPENLNSEPLLLLSGYSYGALVTTSLPPIITSIISPFQTPIPSSPHAEIRMRAAFLADRQNELMNERLSSLLHKTQIEDYHLTDPKTRGASGSVRIGGHEDLRRSSHESHRSRSRNSFTFDTQVSRSVERVRSISRSGPFGHRRDNSTSSTTPSPKEEQKGSEGSPEVTAAEDKGILKAVPNIGQGLKIAYLLVSPLHGWVNALATMSLWGSKSGRSAMATDGSAIPEYETKLTIDPTLALFGDGDVFVSANKLRAWAGKMHGACEGREHPKFRHREVPGAGHFWHDNEALQILQEEVKHFVSTL
jgi:hypothetical protein